MQEGISKSATDNIRAGMTLGLMPLHLNTFISTFYYYWQNIGSSNSMNLVAKAEISRLKRTQVSVWGWCGILVGESHLKLSSDLHPSFLTFSTSCLMKRGLYHLHSEDFPGAVTVFFLFQVDMDSMEVPLQEQSGAYPSQGIVVFLSHHLPQAGVQVVRLLLESKRCCSRRVLFQAADEHSVWKRLKLCWSISWSTKMAWASWSWSPSTISWGKLKPFLCYRQEWGESLLIWARRLKVLLETSTWFWDRSQPRDPPRL